MQQVGGEGQVQIKLIPKVSEYLGLVTTLMMAFGICFQLPVLLTLLARAGLVSSAWLIAQWRYAIVIIFIVAAILSPPDPISQTGVAIPTILLYGLSIYSVRLVEKKRAARQQAEKDAESE
jgi:sec-independent protein translocase protein TatC